jgi:ADP-ribose pyrophosphatase
MMNPDDPRLLESKRIFTGRIFAVELDRLREENGLEIIREVVRHPGGAGVLPLFADGRVALVRQYRHPARARLLEIPAGRIEADETPEECVRREIEEEIGARAGILQKLSEFYATPGFCEEKLHIFLATELTPVPRRPDHDELIEVVYLPLAEAYGKIHSGEIVDAKTIIALLLATRRSESCSI